MTRSIVPLYVMQSSKNESEVDNMIFRFWHFLLWYCLAFHSEKNPQRDWAIGSKDTNK